MVFKKFVSAALSFSLVFSVLLGSTAYAETATYSDTVSGERAVITAKDSVTPVPNISEETVKIKKDEAVRIAKGMLENPEEYELNRVSLSPKWNSEGGYWNVELYRRQKTTENAYVTIDADTGDVTSFDIWTYTDGRENYIARITRSEAQKIAEEYLAEKFKLDLKSYELQKDTPYYYYGYKTGGVKEMVVYNFNYVKKINGVPLPNYNVAVGVDGTNGRIVNYYSNKVDVDLLNMPSPDGVIPAGEAVKKYKDLVNIALQYITMYEQNYAGPSVPKVILAYVPTSYVYMLDAKTGKAINYDGTEVDTSKSEYKQLTENPVPMDPKAKLSDKAVTLEEAKAIAERYKALAEKLFGMKFEDNMQNYYQAYQSGSQDEIFSFKWYNNKDNEYYDLYISINGKNGHITNLGMSMNDYSIDMPAKEGKPVEVKEKVTWEQGKEKALKLVKEIIPDQYGFYADENFTKPYYSEDTLKYMRHYYYTFTRVVNGIRYRDNTISVAIDRETGEMRNFFFSWSDHEFPSPSKVISKEEAGKKYFEDIEAKLSYYLWSKYDQVTGTEKITDTPLLVYTFSSKAGSYVSAIVDAVTGKLIDWSGREVKTEMLPDDSKLPGHWSKRNVELLIAQGIIREPVEDYEKPLTRAEAVKMMSLAKGLQYYYEGSQPEVQSFTDVAKDSDDYVYVENAVRNKILTETGGKFNGGELITGGEFVKLLTNMMGYSDIAKHSEIFTVSGVKNVGYELKGYVAICKVLDTLPVKPGGTFDANGKVTLAEAAAALYKALYYIK